MEIPLTLQTTLFPAVTGYLFGSISFAHVVMRIFARCKEVEKIIVTIPGDDAVIESDSINATTVRLQLGARYGILIAVLECSRQPSLHCVSGFGSRNPLHTWLQPAWQLLETSGQCFTASKAVEGCHLFWGGLFILDWLGTLVTNILGFLLGYPSKNMLVITGGGITLMIPWILLRTPG